MAAFSVVGDTHLYLALKRTSKGMGEARSRPSPRLSGVAPYPPMLPKAATLKASRRDITANSQEAKPLKEGRAKGTGGGDIQGHARLGAESLDLGQSPGL